MDKFTITIEDAVYAHIDWLTQAQYVCMPDAVCYLETMTNESEIDTVFNINEDAGKSTLQ